MGAEGGWGWPGVSSAGGAGGVRPRAGAGGLRAQRVLEPAGCPRGRAAPDAGARPARLPALCDARSGVLEPTMLRVFCPSPGACLARVPASGAPLPGRGPSRPSRGPSERHLACLCPASALGPFIWSFLYSSFTPCQPWHGHRHIEGSRDREAQGFCNSLPLLSASLLP